MYAFAQFIMKNRAYAIGIAALLGRFSIIIPPLSLFSGATVGLVTLQRGVKEGLIVISGATFFLGLASLIVIKKIDLAFLLFIGLWLPSLLGCWILRISRSQTFTLLAIGGISSSFAIGMHLAVGDVVLWWQQIIEQIIQQSNIKGAAAEQFTQRKSLVLMNGLVAMFFGLNLMMTILLARWWQGLLYNPSGFIREFHGLHLPYQLSWVAILLTIVALINDHNAESHITTDLLIIMIMMYLFQGISAIHGLVAARNLPRLWLFPVYLGLFFLSPYFVIGIAIIGIADTLVNFRRPNLPKR
ncbi:DUF2232 domain-containing protein [Candidatus Nitrosacidococcus tergens]|uniref:DUF2232 domain-containing protein n=1 Tax=Candidatus Nitrosacidococcus tergens TaxID=553981 RepID=A0A7G1QAC0_9GAMM|nr:DUF2232 domain-containing protein [Candidatus Nitrosacidococcus tergens]CAB1276424.1 conserved membrane protein of unknown function [Candidatus Nitrosacidococcus tergens]